MRRRLGRLIVSPFPLAGIALGAVLLGHWLAYGLALPQARVRDAVLASTGHAYWAVAVKVAAVVVAVALTRALCARIAGVRRPADRFGSPGLAATARELAAVQVVGFAAMEVAERLAVGAPLTGIVSHGVFLVGLVVQVGLAGLVALVVRMLLRTAERIASVIARPGGFGLTRGVGSILGALVWQPDDVPLHAGSIRAPPVEALPVAPART